MQIEEMKRRKRELGYSNEDIAQLTGVPLGTVQKIFAGITKSPRRDTVVALESLLRIPLRFEGNDKQNNLTDVLVERIYGQNIEMGMPTPMHQLMMMALVEQLRGFVKNSGCRHMVCQGPMAILTEYLDVWRPDIFVIDDGGKFTKHGYQGAPRLIIEVVDDGTRKKDRGVKLASYFDDGVEEYWMIDLEQRGVVVYTLEDDYPVPTRYTFQDSVPVRIFGGECQIDMAEVYGEVAFLEG